MTAMFWLAAIASMAGLAIVGGPLAFMQFAPFVLIFFIVVTPTEG